MSRQRGVVLLLALVLSMLLGLLALEEAEAALHAGARELERAPPGSCNACLPPARPYDLVGQWQASQTGYFHLQNLGVSKRAAHMPEGQPVTLFRITAVSKQTQSRHVLEAVYAVAAGTTQRITWRQRLRGD